MKLAYTQPNGVVAIVIAAPKERLERLFGPLTDEAYETHVIERSIPEGVTDFLRLPDDWQMPDRSKRDLWRIRDGKIVIDKAA